MGIIDGKFRQNTWYGLPHCRTLVPCIVRARRADHYCRAIYYNINILQIIIYMAKLLLRVRGETGKTLAEGKK
jgi:hypothetical protein